MSATTDLRDIADALRGRTLFLTGRMSTVAGAECLAAVREVTNRLRTREVELALASLAGEALTKQVDDLRSLCEVLTNQIAALEKRLYVQGEEP